MEDQLKNPYLILGIDYGSTPEAARAAWARRVRVVKGNPDSAYDVEDLNNALHAIEHADDDAASSVRWFRVPANRASFNAGNVEGLFTPGPITLERQSARPADAELNKLRDAAVRDITRRLLASAFPTKNLNPYAGTGCHEPTDVINERQE